jgi:hypothetical protein
MASDERNLRDKVLFLEAILQLTSVVTSIGRQVNDLKYRVFKQKVSEEEYKQSRELQEEVFKNTDELLARLNTLRQILSEEEETLRHGR